MCKKNLAVKEPAGRDWDGRRTYLLPVSIPGHPIDGNWWSENQSINRYQSIKLIINWYRLVLVNGWSINNYKKKKFIDYYWLTWQPRTDVLHATCLIICHFWEDLGMKLVYNSDPVISMQRIYPVAQVLKSPTCPSLPLHVITSTQEVREKALLNIRCIVRGYHLRCFEVNAGEVFTARGVLPYMGYIGMCHCEGYGFQAVYSRIWYINQSVWV